MVRGVFTNIEELEKEVNKKFKNMMKSKELELAGKEASQAMGNSVGNKVSKNDAGYDYDQTGEFQYLISQEIKERAIHQGQSKLTMGFGNLLNMNDWVDGMRGEQTQRHWIGTKRKGRFVSIRLKEERQMPKWIIAEFGSGSQGGDRKVPDKFKVNYTKREGPIMYGPSKGVVKGEYGKGSKRGYFMVSEQGFRNLRGGDKRYKPKKHPGVKEGRIFSDGLKEAKQEVTDILANGIRNYLRNN